tara:strand:- start:799 stop:1896 length:1098 start_codon:yes stop_codon:yes gene_type:complete
MTIRYPRGDWKGAIEDYPLDEYPDYEAGKSPRFEKITTISHQDEVERSTGQKWGEQGMGRLREVALVRPTEYELNPLFLKNPEFFIMRYYLVTGNKPNMKLLLEQHDAYSKVLKDNGIKVRYMEYEDNWGAYGPLRKHFVAARLGFVLKGGVVIKRWGHGSWCRGMEYHAQKFFADIGCPILLFPSGRAIFEDAWVWPAENVLVGNYGIACNEEAMEQLTPVLKANDVDNVVMGNSTSVMDNMEASGDFHTDVFLGIADLGLAMVYPGQLDYKIYTWLKEHNFRLIEIPPDEQRNCLPSNGVLLEPGKIIMSTEAKKTNAMLRKEGVDVIEVDTNGLSQGGFNGLRCCTCRLLRDQGPELGEIRR